MIKKFEYFTVIRYPKNTKEKKQFIRDVSKVIEKIYLIEARFCKDVFDCTDDNDWYNYENLYKYYLDQFHTVCNWIDKNLELKMIKVNRYYFKQSYKSVVNEKF